jgi:hypothetical protein
VVAVAADFARMSVLLFCRLQEEAHGLSRSAVAAHLAPEAELLHLVRSHRLQALRLLEAAPAGEAT